MPISGNTKTIKSQYHHTTSRNVKKALKLVEVKISDDFALFWSILEKCLMERYGQKPVHNLASIIKLRDNVGDDKIGLFAAYFKGRLIGGIVVFIFPQLVLKCQYIAYDSAYKYLNPIHAIIDYLIDWGNLRGSKYLNLGMANEEEGKKMNSGLFRFKESFGGRGVLRETMYLNID